MRCIAVSFIKQDFLIDERTFLEEERRFFVDEALLDKKLSLLKTLQDRNAAGELTNLSETRVEQSFNERIFCEVFDYKSVLNHSTGEYDLEVKSYHNGLYNDFSLGVFGASVARPKYIVSAELKSPGADLFAPQSGANYKGRSAVEQALATSKTNPTYQWTLVCNFQNLLIFSSYYEDQYLAFDLTQIKKRSQMKRILFVFQNGAFFKSNSNLGRLEIILKRKGLI